MNFLNKLFRREQKKFNLLVVGAQKCGTTSLHQALSMHPEIFMTNPIKEPGYFLPFEVMQKYYAKKGIHLKSEKQYLQKYLLKGYKGEKYFGESSTFYTTEEWSSDFLAKKIFSYNFDIKIIYICRDKIHRIVSHYTHELAKDSSLTFADFLNRNEAFGISLYYKRLLPFIKMFSKESILVLSFEDLISKPNDIMSTVFRFLEVDNSFGYKDLPRLNQKKINITPVDRAAMELLIQQHDRYQELVEDDKLFMHLTRTKNKRN